MCVCVYIINMYTCTLIIYIHMYTFIKCTSQISVSFSGVLTCKYTL